MSNLNKKTTTSKKKQLIGQLVFALRVQFIQAGNWYILTYTRRYTTKTLLAPQLGGN